MLSDNDLASLFAALAHPSRIAILRALLARGTTGLLFGELAKKVAVAPSTLSHHLREMEAAGVVIREPAGRATRLQLDLSALQGTLAAMTALCCSDQAAQHITKDASR